MVLEKEVIGVWRLVFYRAAVGSHNCVIGACIRYKMVKFRVNIYLVYKISFMRNLLNRSEILEGRHHPVCDFKGDVALALQGICVDRVFDVYV